MMATIHVYPSGAITADRDIEPPRVNWLHSVGGRQDVPAHDIEAHMLGLNHECARVRSAREFRGCVEDPREMRRAVLEQYRNHTLVWHGDWSRYE